MSYDKLFQPGEPAFYLAVMDESPFADLSLQLASSNSKAVVRVIRGHKSTSHESFFNEVAAALQFPYYFGENWDAFNDCITDLEWLPGEAYLLLVSNASFLLFDEELEDFRALIRLLAGANQEWAAPDKYLPQNRPSTPFHVVVQCTTSSVAAFVAKLAQAGVEAAFL